MVVYEFDCRRPISGAGLPHVVLDEQRWRRRAWQVSHTLTGLGDAGSGSSLSEQLLQKISPQFLQWCCRQSKQIIICLPDGMFCPVNKLLVSQLLS